MKFNVIFISMAIGLLSHSVNSAPVHNKNNGVADNDGVEVKPYHIGVPGADINIDENGVQVDKDPQVDDTTTDNDDDTANAAAAAEPAEPTEPASSTENDDDASAVANDPSTLDKRSSLLGNMAGLSVTNDGIDVPEAGIQVGGDNNGLADQELNKRRLGGGLAATRDGVDVAPMGLHLGRGSDDPNMATASDAAQLKDVADLLTKRDESNDDDGDDLRKQLSGATNSAKTNEDLMTKRQQQRPGDVAVGLSAEEIDDLMTKREQDSQGPAPPGLSAEELDDFNTRKRDRIAYSAHHQTASYGGPGYPGAYPNQFISEDLADSMT